MEFKSLRAVRLETDIALLKKDEARYRYFVTSTSSDEYRREAMAKLEDTRRKNSSGTGRTEADRRLANVLIALATRSF
jgi:hypothetical protein